MTEDFAEMVDAVQQQRSEREDMRSAAQAALGAAFKADALSSPLGVFSAKASPEAVLRLIDEYDAQEARTGRLAVIVLCIAKELEVPDDATPQAVLDAVRDLKRQLAESMPRPNVQFAPSDVDAVSNALSAQAVRRTSRENVIDVLQALALIAAEGEGA